jgi:hypothetical protein
VLDALRLPRVAEYEDGRSNNDGSGDPERHCGDETRERCRDQDRTRTARADECEDRAREGKCDDGDGENAADGSDYQQRGGESPLSMLNALKKPAKSSCATGIGIALAAPSAASAPAAMRLPVMSWFLFVAVMRRVWPESLAGNSPQAGL